MRTTLLGTSNTMLIGNVSNYRPTLQSRFLNKPTPSRLRPEACELRCTKLAMYTTRLLTTMATIELLRKWKYHVCHTGPNRSITPCTD
jgi:hypothetical protein